MSKDIVQFITSKIINLQDSNGCWDLLDENDKYYPDLLHYTPNYSSTLWTLILLADIQSPRENKDLIKPLRIISDHFLGKENNIFSLGKTHFPIPCLNGNMLYLLSYFKFENEQIISDIVDFFYEYQRFDDGDFKTPSSFPYCSNRSCYGKHTCYWGIVKLLKGLSFIEEKKRSEKVNKLIGRSIDFILLHEVCFSSRNKSDFLHTNIKKLTFPNMYQSDFLEILWLLKREKIKSVHINRALNLLKDKMKPDSTWKIERSIKNLIIPMGFRNYGYEFITGRAKEVLEYYSI